MDVLIIYPDKTGITALQTLPPRRIGSGPANNNPRSSEYHLSSIPNPFASGNLRPSSPATTLLHAGCSTGGALDRSSSPDSSGFRPAGMAGAVQLVVPFQRAKYRVISTWLAAGSSSAMPTRPPQLSSS